MNLHLLIRLLMRMLKYIFNYSWAIIWGLIVLVLMGMPSPDLPRVRFFEGFDKLVHCGSFFVFTVLLLLGSIRQSKRRASKIKTVVFTALVAGVFAFLTEGVQLYLEMGRMADWWDIFADFVGIGMALFAYLLLHHKRATYS